MRTDDISDLIKRVAAAEITPRFRNLREDEIVFKEPGEFVTAADLAAEYALTDGLKSMYPDAIITGEEDISKNPMRLVELLSADCGFLIDPIDGTNNFIKGEEQFAVMVVALRSGEVVASWIYLPVFDVLAAAEAGTGAFINDEKVTLKPAPEKISAMIGAAHINRMPENIRKTARENLKKIKENKPAFCAGYDYVAITRGEKHFSAYHRTLLWDHLPGTLIYKEAGGYVMGLDGKPYTPRNDGSGLLCAPDKASWNKIKSAIFP